MLLTAVMNHSDILKEISQKEIDLSCYNIRVNNRPIYTMIRSDVRRQILRDKGIKIASPKDRIHKLSFLYFSTLSIFHIIKLLLLGRKYNNLFFAFPRLDSINGLYMDKFTDPIIEQSNINDYLIFDFGRGGFHYSNRLHKKNIVYSESIYLLAAALGFCGRAFFLNKHKAKINDMINAIEAISGNKINKKFYSSKVVSIYYYISLMKFIMHRLDVKHIFGPSRQFMLVPFMAAYELGIKRYEFQHGVTYNETVSYSGYRDPYAVPDNFLAFGDNDPLDVYGIDNEKIVNIGFAFLEYADKLFNKSFNTANKVLVLSDPGKTEYICTVVAQIAQENPDYHFAIRTHPHEEINRKCLDIISKCKNIQIQDKRINIIQAFYQYDLVIGENSTAMYEAVSLGKKTAKLNYCNLHAMYLKPEDRDCFWQIDKKDDFKSFASSIEIHKKKKAIYSPFKNKIFMRLIE